jgi:hypothetical protein
MTVQSGKEFITLTIRKLASDPYMNSPEAPKSNRAGVTPPTALSMVQQMADRANCWGMADWLQKLAVLLRLPANELTPINATSIPAASSRLNFNPPGFGLNVVMFHPHAQSGVTQLDPDRWALERLTFHFIDQGSGAWQGQLPFGLDATAETPQSAAEKLSDDHTHFPVSFDAAADRRVSYFLHDARVIECVFLPGGAGLERLGIVRLGKEQNVAHLMI